MNNNNDLYKNKLNNKEIKEILDDSDNKMLKQTNSGNFIEIKFDDKFKFYDLSNYHKNGILKMNLKHKLDKYNNILLFISDGTDLDGIKIGNNNFLKNKYNNINNNKPKFNIFNLFLNLIYLSFTIYIICKVNIKLKKNIIN